MITINSTSPHCYSTIRLNSLQMSRPSHSQATASWLRTSSSDFGLRLSKYLTRGYSKEGETRSGDLQANNNKDEIKEGVESIRNIFESMDEASISSSAYDSAWIAMIKNVDGSDTPQFPSTLQWIANNQLPDGSWGCDRLFSAYDRLSNTLACVVALKTWNIHPKKCNKGISFFIQNLNKLEDEKSLNMTCGFEINVPSLLKLARGLGIELPFDSPILETLYAKREKKFKRIPKDIMHEVPTTLLYSLEGLDGIGLNWEKLLKLKCEDGSFFNSPSSTAYAFMHTKDEGCLQYLTRIVNKFNGPAPTTYPVEMFERIWVVDRLGRLGISRYFQPEISKQCIDYAKRYWNNKGIAATRKCNVPDLDDTCMGFRLLRLHGHHVSPDVFSHFKEGNQFFCFPGQSDEGASVMYNFYRASQVSFPGETILQDAREFTYKFLREKQIVNDFSDKWVLAKDLAGEVEYGLEVPWYANLPRVETRYYLEQYGGDDDIWIAKVLYRFSYVNNNTYLEVAKLDYNNCQALHKCEWVAINKWYREFEVGDLGVIISKETILRAYFVAAANIFEPERCKERVAWAKNAILLETISAYFQLQEATLSDHKKAFVSEFLNIVNKHETFGRVKTSLSEGGKELVRMLVGTLDDPSLDTHGRDHLLDVWKEWLGEGESYAVEAELIVGTIILTSSLPSPSQEIFSHPDYPALMALTNSVCSKLRLYKKHKVHDGNAHENVDMESSMTTPEIETEMQQLVQLVLDNSSNSMDPQIKTIFLTVAKSYYYTAYFPITTIDAHAAKVLFEKVD